MGSTNRSVQMSNEQPTCVKSGMLVIMASRISMHSALMGSLISYQHWTIEERAPPTSKATTQLKAWDPFNLDTLQPNLKNMQPEVAGNLI